MTSRRTVIHLFLNSLSVLSLIACSRNSDLRPAKKEDDLQIQQRALSLSGLSPSQVMKKKYSKANLICSLWTQVCQSLNLSLPANDSISIDLIANDISQTELSLSGSAGFKSRNVQLLVKSFEIKNIYHELGNGNAVEMKYSPVIDLEVNYRDTSIADNGSSIASEGHSQQLIYEKIKTLIYEESLQSGRSGAMKNIQHDHLDCMIDTEIYPEYQDQFTARSI